MKFEWDENKNLENIQRHGIDFNDVVAIFYGPMIVNHDDRFDYNEDRLIGVGFMKHIVAIVVFIEKMLMPFELFQRGRQIKMKPDNSKKKFKTDWDKLNSISDSEINYSDAPELEESFFKEGKLRMPRAKSLISIRLDPDVLEWFKSYGAGYQTRINAVLRMYMKAHKQNP